MDGVVTFIIVMTVEDTMHCHDTPQCHDSAQIIEADASVMRSCIVMTTHMHSQTGSTTSKCRGNVHYHDTNS